MEYPDGGHWQGKNFVFDKREAFGVDNRAGDGGVVKQQKPKKKDNKKKDKSKKDKVEEEDDKTLGRCSVCSESWDRYIGKKKVDVKGHRQSDVVVVSHLISSSPSWFLLFISTPHLTTHLFLLLFQCSTCQVPLLVCPRCLSSSGSSNKKNKKNKQGGEGEQSSSSSSDDKASASEQQLGPRCPLCVSQGVVVPASALELTDNGKSAKVAFSYGGGGGGATMTSGVGAAAPTVCKWGGGHSSKFKGEGNNKRKGNSRKREQEQHRQKEEGLQTRDSSSSFSSGAPKKAKYSSKGGHAAAPVCRYGAACERANCHFKH